MQALHFAEQATKPLIRGTLLSSQRHLNGEFGQVGEEFVQRRIKEADRHRQPIHGRKDALEVFTLERQESCQGKVSLRVVRSHDQVFDELATLTQEHVLGATQPNPFCAKSASPGRVLRRVCIGPNGQSAYAICMSHESGYCRHQLAVFMISTFKMLYDDRVVEGDGAMENLAAGAVDGDDLAFVDSPAVGE